MESDPKISVIVPVYNVEKYLNKCVESIVNQTYKNLEIILIDDGSPDNCPKICDEWAEKDDRIKVIHKENGGVSSARNAGLDLSSGDFIGFVDADDYVNENTYSFLIDDLIKHQSDVSMCSINFLDKNGNIYKSDDELNLANFIEDNCNNIVNEMYKTCNCHWVALWNKLYSKEIFKTLRFPEGRLFEDWTIVPMIYYKCKRLSYISDKLYNYLARREGSAVHTYTLKRYYDCACADYDHYLFFSQKNFHKFDSDISMYIVSDFKKCIKSYKPSKENKNYIKKAYKMAYDVSKNKLLFFMRCFPVLFKIFFKVVSKLRNVNSADL